MRVVVSGKTSSLVQEVVAGRHRLIKGVALLPLQDPTSAADELKRAVRELGAVSGMLAADGCWLLGHQRFDPIYAAAQALGVPLAVHAGGTD